MFVLAVAEKMIHVEVSNCTFGKEVGAKICHAFVCTVAWLIDTFCSEPGICEGRKLKWRPVDSVKSC